ncbi:MAG TPA: cation:proton antiporter [Acidimicrobiales bacterium]|nr:cation:proton antiporter [Acidimicrobiales bacterium]
MTSGDFGVFAGVLAVAAIVGLVATRLRQPLIVSFIAVGIAVGPVGLGWVEGGEGIELLAKLGIAVLLFLVGLKLDLHLVRETGPVALATGLGQVTFTSLVGFGIARLLGMDTTTALYVAVALTFSSTIIIVKLLSDKRELDELHGRIAVGFLIVQDIVVVLVMITLSAFGRDGDDQLTVEIARVVGSGLGLLAAIALATRYVLPRVLPAIARSSELLVLFAVAWAVGLAAVSDWLGFSTEVGAFLAGVSLASTPFREAVGARLVSLRDFLLLFFFLELGAGLEFTDAAAQLFDAVVLSVFVLVGNPLIVMVIMGAMGYRARTSFLAGLTVAQISEFSLILVALGLSLGHIDNSTVSLVTVVGLITIGISTYMILSSKQLFVRLEPVLRHFERAVTRDDVRPAPEPVDVILFGLGRFGATVARTFVDSGHRILAVDLDPQATATWSGSGIETVFGDADDLDLVETLPLHRCPLVVSTLPDADANVALYQHLRANDYAGRIGLIARKSRDAERYRAIGAELVLEPFGVAAHELVEIVDRARAADGAQRAVPDS